MTKKQWIISTVAVFMALYLLPCIFISWQIRKSEEFHSLENRFWVEAKKPDKITPDQGIFGDRLEPEYGDRLIKILRDRNVFLKKNYCINGCNWIARVNEKGGEQSIEIVMTNFFFCYWPYYWQVTQSHNLTAVGRRGDN